MLSVLRILDIVKENWVCRRKIEVQGVGWSPVWWEDEIDPNYFKEANMREVCNNSVLSDNVTARRRAATQLQTLSSFAKFR